MESIDVPCAIGEIKISGYLAPKIISDEPPMNVPRTPAGVNFFQNTPRKIAVTSGGVSVE